MLAAILGGMGLALASCQAPSGITESIGQVDFSAKTPRPVAGRGAGPVQKSDVQRPRYEVFPGVRPNPGDGADPPPGLGEQDDGTYTINLDAASVQDAAKLILGETLHLNYTIDPNLQATVTMVSNRPVTGRQLIDAFEAALRATNVALVQSNGQFKVIQGQQVMDGDVGRLDLGKSVSSGYGVSAVPLRYVSPASMVELLDGFVAQVGSTRASKAGNMILIRGPAAQRRSLVEVVLSFDIDTMRSQSTGIAALENGRAEDVAAKLDKIFAQDSANAGPNALRIIPVPSINTLVVIASTADKVNRAITWIKRLDRDSLDAPKSYVYAVQNGSAVDLAKILSASYGSGSADAGATAEVAPNKETTSISLNGGSASGQQLPGGMGSGQPGGGADTMTTQSTTPDGTEAPAETSGPSGFPGGGGGGDATRITPIATNNTLLIRATPRTYRDILATLKQIDAPATQVLITTTIAEVQLNNQLNYGVQAYFKNSNFNFLFTKSDTNAISTSVPGMNYVLGSVAQPKLIIDALAKVTKVRIVSSPSVLVLENETATIKVGDSVPVQTQASSTTAGQPLNNYDYRDTGVLLKVKPRVSANGVVTIDLGQELSDVLPNSGKTVGDNPTFTQRTINSKVSVNDQQTVVMGGLIKGSDDKNRLTVPGADRVPILGKLIGTTDTTGARTELIVFITPTIVRNGQDAATTSQDLRDKMKNLTFD